MVWGLERHAERWGGGYRKTPLISTYLIPGLAKVQVLVFGGRAYFRG